MNFGEILEPSSRAFWEGFDDDAEDEQLPIPEPKWLWKTENSEPVFPDEIDLFIVVEGTNIIKFIKSIVLKDDTPICRLEKGAVSLYRIKDSKQYICVSDENDLTLSGTTTELLVPWISVAKNVITLSIQSRALYKGSDDGSDESVTMIRGIGDNLLNGIKTLTVPNFITGIGAGVASWRYIIGKNYSTYVVYVDTPEIDGVSADPVIRLLNRTGLKCDEKYIVKLNDQSSLYM